MKKGATKFVVFVFVVAAFLGVLPLIADAKSAGIEWEILVKEAEELYKAGNYSRGIIVAQKALELAEKNVGHNHPDVARSLNVLAILYQTIGEYTKAELLFKRSLAIFEKALGPNHLHVATSLNNLASLYYNQKENAKAEPLFKRSLAILEKALGPEHLYVAAGLNNGASL